MNEFESSIVIKYCIYLVVGIIAARFTFVFFTTQDTASAIKTLLGIVVWTMIVGFLILIEEMQKIKELMR